MNPAEVAIEFSGKLDLRSTLECGQIFKWHEVTCAKGFNWYKGVIDSHGVMVKLTADSRLLVAYDDKIKPEDNFVLNVFEYFSLDDDLDLIHKSLREADFIQTPCHKTDLVMSKAVEHAQGLRIIRQDPWECLVSYIISANKNIPAINKIVRNISEMLGSPTGFGEYTFPAPQTVLDAGVDLIRQSKCGYRAPYVIDAAKKVVSGQVDLDALWKLPTKEARQHLLKIKGVGPKVADCVLLFAYHRLNVFPVDIWIARCMSKFYMNDLKITSKQAKEEGNKRFSPYAGYAQQVLFNYSRNILKGDFALKT